LDTIQFVRIESQGFIYGAVLNTRRTGKLTDFDVINDS